MTVINEFIIVWTRVCRPLQASLFELRPDKSLGIADDAEAKSARACKDALILCVLGELCGEDIL
jgi:hypothetical protein